METVVRVALIYVLVLAGLRVMGKREFGQMAPIEFVALLLIPEMVSQALVGDDYSLTNALVAVGTLFVVVFLNSVLSDVSKPYEDLVEAKPTVLVHNGKLVEDNMYRERITAGELFTEMHKSGLERLEQVRWAVLEGDGKIAIVPAESS